jgi:hypothetical protein
LERRGWTIPALLIVPKTGKSTIVFGQKLFGVKTERNLGGLLKVDEKQIS